MKKIKVNKKKDIVLKGKKLELYTKLLSLTTETGLKDAVKFIHKNR